MRRTLSDDMATPSATWRVPRQPRGMDPDTKKLALIAAGVGGALVVLVGVWGAVGHRPAGVPVIAADSRPIRVRPENPGGLQVAGANDEILSGGDTDGEAGKLAPPAEMPAPQALRAQQDAARAAEDAAKSVPAPALTASLPAPSQTVPHQAVHESHPPPMAALPAQRPAPPPAQHPAPTASSAPAQTQPGGRQVQLAALGSEEAARTEWQHLAKRMPDLFNGRRPAFSKTEHDGHALWRLRIGGFTDTAQATIFCERVRAKGAGCSVASF
jgi:hypothetical protein